MILTAERECRRTGATIRTLSVPLAAHDQEIVEIVRAGLRAGRPRLLIVDQLTSPTARYFVNAWGGRGWLRLSGQVYNQPEEYDRLAKHLPGLLAEIT